MKLNKIFSLTVALAVATLALSGCIRETYPKEAGITESQLMKGEETVILQSLLPGIHSGLISTAGGYEHTDYGYFGLQVYHDFECKNCVCNGWTLGHNPLYNRFYNAAYGWYYTANSLMPAMTWMSYYPTIKSCNQIIGIAKDVEDYKVYRGIAKAYRAMLYLDLARLFEPLFAEAPNYGATYEMGVLAAQGLTVPYVDENATEESVKNNPRLTREEMFTRIFADLKDAAECLKDYVPEKPFYPSQAVVYGLYARAYMWLGGFDGDGLSGELPEGKAAYQLALDYAQKAISAFGGAIMTKEEWTNPTTGFNTVASSWMLSVVNSSDTLISNLHQHPAHMAPEALYGYPQFTSPGVSALVYDNLGDADFRKALIKGPETTLADFPYTTITDKSTFDLFAPYTFFKYRPGKGAQTDSTTAGSVSLPLMRCEEMYFIEMEAIAHISGDEAARPYLNAFMEKRDESYIQKPNVLDEILFQKGIEFWGEGLLMYDKKRLDRGVNSAFKNTNYDANARHISEGRLPWWTYCIPQSELERNEGIGVNNPDPSRALDPVADLE